MTFLVPINRQEVSPRLFPQEGEYFTGKNPYLPNPWRSQKQSTILYKLIDANKRQLVPNGSKINSSPRSIISIYSPQEINHIQKFTDFSANFHKSKKENGAKTRKKTPLSVANYLTQGISIYPYMYTTTSGISHKLSPISANGRTLFFPKTTPRNNQMRQNDGEKTRKNIPTEKQLRESDFHG